MRILLASSIALLLMATQTTIAQLAPPFGGVPAGGSIGIGIRGGGFSGTLGLSLGQSSSRSITSSSASVTTMDGVPGYFFSGVTRPFVTGYIPIVGDYGPPIDYQAVFAQQSRQGMERARRSQQNIRNKSLEKHLRRIDRAEREGNKKMARANYRRAISLADEPLRSELITRMKEMLSQR